MCLILSLHFSIFLFFIILLFLFFFFFFNDTATTEIYTLSLHDALPIWASSVMSLGRIFKLSQSPGWVFVFMVAALDRKSTRLNSSHRCISYAVFCLKKKKNKI